jgi:hypothetical protein
MEEYTFSEPERTEDGAFLVKVIDADGNVLATGSGDSLEQAIEDAKSKSNL